MSGQIKIVIAGIDPLRAYALEILARRLSSNVSVITMRDDSLVPDGDFYIIGCGEFLGRLQYYMPRKSHIAIVTDGNGYAGYSDKALSNNEILVINADDSVERIEDMLHGRLSACNGEETETGDLSGREKEVLLYVAQGYTIKEIAARLGISVNTVLTHRKNISTKLGIKSVTGLSLYAMMNGML